MSALAIKLLVGVIGIALVTGLYFGWQQHERALGAANVEASNFAAIAQQNMKDAVLSKQIAIKLQARVSQLEAAAQQGNAAIDLAPPDPGSPADEAAAAAVNAMLEGAK